ncbi:MAG: putative DNA binding domain-containing protein [Tissierellales bacterium]|nr:putative DNA binding domain-containing protein [Tissierellales bacterium]
MDGLYIEDRIKESIALRESQFREFKSAYEGRPDEKIPRSLKCLKEDICRTLVAFANADGGTLLVGVEDDGTITGIPHDEKKIAILLDTYSDGIHKETPLSSVHAEALVYQSQRILFFSVDKSTTMIHQTSDGRCLKREDKNTIPVNFERLQFERREQISRQYDREFAYDVKLDALDIELVQRISNRISKTKMTPEKFLQFYDLADYSNGRIAISRAALLLFGKDTQRILTRMQVRIVRVPGTEFRTGRHYTVTSDDTVSGNIFELITSSWDLMRPFLVRTEMNPDALFVERVMYPEDACREALMNAIVHRDYSMEGKGVEVIVFDDRIEISSPGPLLSTIDIDDLRNLTGVHESRNTLIARILRECGYVREIGEGMRRIFELFKEADLVRPELESSKSTFKIMLRCKSVFSADDQRWLKGYSAYNLSREEMIILLLGKDGGLLSPNQIVARLNIVDWDIYRQVFQRAQCKGLIYNASKGGGRDRKRLKVRTPEIMERAYSELISSLQKVMFENSPSTNDLKKIKDYLGKDNPLNQEDIKMRNMLQELGFLNEAKFPTERLMGLWLGSKRDESKSFYSVEVKDKKKQESNPVDLYIGNLDYNTSEDEIRKLFLPEYKIRSVHIPIDYTTGNGRGFAF